jgi:hypothetical protein
LLPPLIKNPTSFPKKGDDDFFVLDDDAEGEGNSKTGDADKAANKIDWVRGVSPPSVTVNLSNLHYLSEFFICIFILG